MSQVPIKPVSWNSIAGRNQTTQKTAAVEREVIVIDDREEEEEFKEQYNAGTQRNEIVILDDDDSVPHTLRQPSTQQIMSKIPTSGPTRVQSATNVRRSAAMKQQQQQHLDAASSTQFAKVTSEKSANGSGVASSSFATSFHPPMSLQEFISTLLTAQTRGTFTERFVQANLAQLSPEVFERVSSCYHNRRNLDEFLAMVQLIPVQATSTATLGLDMSLPEFQRLVLDDLIMESQQEAENQSGHGEEGDQLVGGQTSGQRLDTAIEEAMCKLGPETRGMVEEAWVTRLSTAGFCRELSMMRPFEAPRTQFTIEQLGTVTQSLLLAESKLRSYVPLTSVQTAVTMKMRSILMDWLTDVSERFKCGNETLHLACALVDRYLSLHPVLKSELQLLGVSAMVLAAKYEMVYPPEMRDYIYISACTYTKDDIIRMERSLFVALEYNVTIPTTNTIGLAILQQQDPLPHQKQIHVLHYLLDSLLISLPYNSHPPHVIAATAVYLSRLACGVTTTYLPDVRRLVPEEIRKFLPTAYGALVEAEVIPASATTVLSQVGGSPNSTQARSSQPSRFRSVKTKYSGAEKSFVSGDAYPPEQWELLMRAVTVDLEMERKEHLAKADQLASSA